MPDYSKAARRFIAQEISHLFHDKGYDLDRAIAAALSQARRKGFKVPPRPNPKLALVNPSVGRLHSGRDRMLGTAVYQINYRHADDGYDYFHEFEKPDQVKLVLVDRHHVMIVGEVPIIELFEQETR